MAAEKGHCANCAPFYHYPLSIAVLKIKNKQKSSKFYENGEIEWFLALTVQCVAGPQRLVPGH